MSRPLRILYPDAVYHVMNRGLARQATFLDPADHVRFTEFLDDLRRRWQVRIFAYCCMTNHYHLLHLKARLFPDILMLDPGRRA